MKTIRKQYTEEFKREAVALVADHGYNYSSAGRSLGIDLQLIAKWCKLFATTGVVSVKNDPLQQKLLELEAENRRLCMEKEILKKAAAFFARESM
jgi:transposase